MAARRTTNQVVGTEQKAEDGEAEVVRGAYVTTVEIIAGGHLHQAGQPLHDDVSRGEIESMLRMRQIIAVDDIDAGDSAAA
ncbi:hypothetical protein Pan44_26750 [Caulifigura coniformis]|uniref:Uncharacterized protein n=1 Tax=Caulifigura coniformis TaxID=2527983 RepID=A0A517SEW1_9PLAN|nr:hypothetical protein [Caulifigura coniformis]QDT54640.1 hypothetical protein Pan44_26750 [Caulifigura coniformis]